MSNYVSHSSTFEERNFQQFLNFQESSINHFLKDHLFDPISEFMSRPSKNFRSQLMKIGYQLSPHKDFIHNRKTSLQIKKNMKKLSLALEYLHAGSLIIDDIQDGDLIRRGGPAIHRLYGVPLAINIGNWLYFCPLTLISSSNFENEKKIRLYESYSEIMIQAHLGQAIDLKLKINQITKNEILEIYKKTTQLKTGTLFDLAIRFGLILGEARDEDLFSYQQISYDLGLILQIYNDLHNFLVSYQSQFKNIPNDLITLKPHWAWVVISLLLNDHDYLKMMEMSQKQNDYHHLIKLIEKYDIVNQSILLAKKYQESLLNSIKEKLIIDIDGNHEAYKKLHQLIINIENVYVEKTKYYHKS